MRGHFRLPMGAMAGALLGLIALLASLQYRWLGQISGAERDRMKATLNIRASDYAQDVDRELTRAYLLFQLDGMQHDGSAVASLNARHDRWQATARFPRMIKDIYLVSSKDDAGWGPPQRFNVSTRFLEPAEWPPALADVKKAIGQVSLPPQHTSSTTTGGTTTSFVLRQTVPAVWSTVPALVIGAPMLMVSHLDVTTSGPTRPPVRMSSGLRYTIVLLDGGFIRNEMLPALAQQHFKGTGDGFDYELAVVPAAGRQAPLYRSVPAFAPAPDTAVDAAVDLFQVRVKDFEALAQEVSRFTALASIPPELTARTQTFVRQTVTPGRNVIVNPAPMSIILQDGATGGSSQQRFGTMITGAAAAFGARAATPSVPQWRLMVKHPSGSLERAVDAVRRRNLVISTSILGVLGISVGFLVVSTRRAHDLARQQLEFVASVSHELRTPLAVIRSAADNLADGVVNDETRVRQYGQLVRREGLRLTDLVEQILEFAGLQSGQKTMTAKPVAIAALLRDAAATAEATGPGGMNIELSIAENLPAVAGDEAALRRVFQNLLGNAVKYGAEARWIGVRAAGHGPSVEISVTDKGIGISPADQARIFDPFYRAPGVVSAQIQGAGLGLSLVKRIVEAHGGQVAVTSAPGEGSTFLVTLPVLDGDSADGRDRVGAAAAQPL